MLSYWIRSSENHDKQPFRLLRFPTAFTIVIGATSLPEAAGYAVRQALAPEGTGSGPEYPQALCMLTDPGMGEQ